MKKKSAIMQDERHLPENRHEVFFDRLFLGFGTFVRMGAALLLFALPYLALYLFRDVFFGYMKEVVPAGEMTAFLRSYGVLFDAGGCILLVLAALGLAGIFRAVRQLAFGEGMSFFGDIGRGIRVNGKLFCALAVVAGVFRLLADMLLTYQTSQTAMKLAPIVLAVVLFAPVLLLCLAHITVYRTTLIGCVRDCLWLYGKTLPKTLGVSLLVEAPLLVLLLPNTFVRYGVLALLLLFVAPVALFGWFLYACCVFDRYINAERYPELVDKGVFKGEQRY